MSKRFSINLKSLSIPQPTDGTQVFAEDLSGMSILCLVLSQLGFRIVPLTTIVEGVDERYINELYNLIVPNVIGIPSGAAAEVIPINFNSYLIQFTY